MELSYNGKAYHGWQIQPNALTIQQVIEDALKVILKEDLSIVGAGRTDTGVHALQMYAHFDTERKIDEEDLIFKLNSYLPKDISITDLFLVANEAHARFDAISREYVYRISTRKDVFNIDQAYLITSELDIERMNAAAKILLTYRDFQCFSKSNTDVKTYHCNIYLAEWIQTGNELKFKIRADRFLRNMVRAIVGTLIEIGSGKRTVDELHDIIGSKDRRKAGYSVPAHGLFLKEIIYPEAIRNHE